MRTSPCLLRLHASALVPLLLVALTLGLSVLGCDCGSPTLTGRDVGADVPMTMRDGGRDTGDMPLPDAGVTSEVCNGLDDDGDGRVDELCECEVGTRQPCYPGDPALGGVGTCTLGSQTCMDIGTEFGVWGACSGAEPPAGEICDDRDNDCDGMQDDGCECTAGTREACYTGPAGTLDIGRCRGGERTCEAGPGGVGTMFGACTGSVLPGTETCNGIDDDCNGAIDEGCSCTDGASRSCYTGPPGTEDVGLCAAGTQYCTDDGMGMATWGGCSGATLPGTDVCNGIDDDCDGMADEDCLCPPGATRACYSGDPTTRGNGLCRDGIETCELAPGGAGSDFGACTGERLPAAELCDGADNDCDGLLDEDCGCRLGESRTCYSGDPATVGEGMCRSGMQTCVASTDGSGMWSACGGEVLPGAEVCGDGADGDCDGVIDDGCVCTSGASRACYAGPAGTRSVGECRDGSQSCVVGSGGVGSDWGTCGGSRLPSPELCDGLDNNCNGTADEGCGCVPGSTRSCYSGPAGTSGVGICQSGNQTCDLRPDGTAEWSSCAGSILPATEACNGRDDDCDGMQDEGCDCDPGSTRACYAGAPATRGVGVCSDGLQTCSAGGAWGACGGGMLPGTEVCDGRDNNCNGATDEGCSCPPRTSRLCYTGPMGTDGVGICRSGSQTCNLSPDGTTSSWGACSGAILPGAEVCNGSDDDCDGMLDDGCACTPGSTRSCYGGPAGTRGLGICRDGVESCVAGAGGIGSAWGSCTGWVGPAAEICNGTDDNCNGVPDETCMCMSGEVRTCYSGPPATRMVGACRDGSQMCSFMGGMATWGACAGERLPVGETCNTMDDDCDARVDEGACMIPPTVTCPPPATTRPLIPVTLTGSAMDADGVIASYQWTLISGPAGATGTFSAPTSASTQFTPNLVGVYTVQLTVRDNMGLTATCTTTVTARGDGIRVEVTWDTNFTDIDTHFLRMASGAPWFMSPNDCYFANRTPLWDAPGLPDDPRLDIDDVNGFGPENINIDSPVLSSTYRVGIHYWTGTPATTVTVRIYCGDIAVVPVATYTRTLLNGSLGIDSNDFWRVADVRWTGPDMCTVTTLNTLTTGGIARTTP